VRRRRRTLLALLGVALLAGVGANASAQSSASDTGATTAIGGFAVASHGEGITFTYNSPGLIPGTPSPLFAASLPESLTNMDSGPSGYALASLVYPGPLVADLPTVLALGGVPNANQIPSYPVRSQAYYPAGPTDASQQVGSGQEVVSAAEKLAPAQVVYGAAQLPPVMTAGSITSTSESEVADDQVVTRTRVELSNVDVALGLVHMDSIVTDLVATSDGNAAATDGTTTVNGMKVLGQPATIDASGVHLAPSAAAPPPSSSSASPLDPITNAVQPAVDPLNQLLASTLGSANEDVNKLLVQGGIDVRLIQPTEVKNGGEASRLASGVLVTIRYDGSTEPVLSSLLNLIPVESLPSQGVGPIPFSSPQSIVLALKATHVETIGFAAGSVHAKAAPPVSLPPVSSTGTPLASSTAANGFATPTPSIGAGGNGSPAGGGSSLGANSPVAFVAAAPLAAVLSALLLLLAGSTFWFGSGRLADNVLSVSSSSCPEGLDHG
jgi:hypothetical protein